MIVWEKEDFLVAQEQKLGARGHPALLEHSLVKTDVFSGLRGSLIEYCWRSRTKEDKGYKPSIKGPVYTEVGDPR